jgi:hypothetical protein
LRSPWILTSPLKLWRLEREQELVTEPCETRRGKILGEDIGELVRGRDELHDNITAEHFFTHKVIVNFDVLCASMEDGIRC